MPLEKQKFLLPKTKGTQLQSLIDILFHLLDKQLEICPLLSFCLSQNFFIGQFLVLPHFNIRFMGTPKMSFGLLSNYALQHLLSLALENLFNWVILYSKKIKCQEFWQISFYLFLLILSLYNFHKRYCKSISLVLY